MSYSYSPSGYKPEVDSDDDVGGYSPQEVNVKNEGSPSKYVPSEVGEIPASPGSDNEYHVEPPNDPTTPAYAPSRPASASEDEFVEHVENQKAAVPARTPDSESAGEGQDAEPKEALAVGEEDAEGQPEGFEGEEGGTKEMIADIFGESDNEEEEEFEGFAENEVDKDAAAAAATLDEKREGHNEHPHRQHRHGQVEGGSDNDDEEEGGDEFVSDFDRIMSRRREETRRKRRLGKDEEFLNDSDDIIRETITKMRISAEEDRHLISRNRPATKKLAMLNVVSSLLKKADMKPALMDNGILSAITDWLSPLPGQTLPNVTIRDTLLRHLGEFSIQDPDLLRESGIGKAVMYLYKHPRETKDNKKRAGHLINEWSRPIFNLTSDYRTLSKEERKQLDYEHLPKRRHYDSEEHSNRDLNQDMLDQQGRPLRPGDPGWVNRARVPQPSNRDYVVRPKWKMPTDSSAFDDDDYGEDVEGDGTEDGGENAEARRRRRQQQQQMMRRSAGGSSSSAGASSRIETHIRTLAKNAASQKKSRFVRAVPMSIEGRKMAL